MATADTERIREVADIDTVVDTDVHTSYGDGGDEELFEYMPEPYSEFLNRDSWRHGIYPAAGYVRPGHYSELNRDKITSPERVRRMMATLETDQVILVGGPLRIGMMHHEELGAAMAQAHNDWMLDTLLDEVSDCYGAAIVQPQLPDLAVEEIDRRADESDIVAVLVPSGGVTPPLGREQYFPIYEAAEDAGLPVIFHGSVTGIMSTFISQWQGTKRYLDIHTVGFPAEAMWHLSTLLTNGVPVRFPDLPLVIQEAGVGWIPYFMRRYDEEYSKKRQDAPLLERKPSDYIRERFYFTSQPVEGADDPTYLNNAIRAFGGETQLMFSSDYPHHDFDYPEKFLRTLGAGFDDDVIEDIYGGTAKRLFGI